jgi:hypothetical protein
MSDEKNQRLRKIINVLQFLLTIEDLEIIHSSLEGVVESLEEEIESS